VAARTPSDRRCGPSKSCARRRVEVDRDEDALAEELVEAELSGEHVADGVPSPPGGHTPT
jgi:hypothetical protein